MTETTAIEVRKPTTTSLIPDAQNLRILATDLFNSRIIRGIENVPQAVAVIQYGAELGIGPMQALTNIKPIMGQMTMSARLIMGLAASSGVSWKVIESTAKRCEIHFSRQGWEPVVSVFTIEEAERAGLVKPGGGWDKYPQDMLFARAGTRGIRRIAPDAGFGKTYSTEEMTDASEPGGAVPADSPIETDTVPQKEEEKRDTLFPGEDDGDDIADIANKAEAEARGETPEMEAAIRAIKAKLEAEGVDEKSFKEWLFKFQNTIRPVRAYVGKIGTSLRWHLGRQADVIGLSDVEAMDKAIAKFRGRR